MACSQDFVKTIEGTNSTIEAVEHSSSDISRQHSFDRKKVRGNFNEQKYFNFSASLSGFCHISEKTVLKPSHQIEIFVLKKDTHTMNLTLTEEKMDKVIFKCQIFFSLPQITVLLWTKLIDLMFFTVQTIFVSSSIAKLFTTTASTISIPGLYQAEVVLNSFSKQELLW